MQETSRIEFLLAKHQLKKTPTRLEVLRVYVGHPYALSHSDIEHQLSASHDRVTLYRTLHTFEEKGLIHKVPGADGVMRFALCADDCEPDHRHHDNHVHFNCTQCGNVFCVDDVKLPAIRLPEGYTIDSVNLTLSGRCRGCHA